MILFPLLFAAGLNFSQALFCEVFTSPQGSPEAALVLVDIPPGETQVFNEKLASLPLPPCSTFKIWNTDLGLETGILTSPDQPFLLLRLAQGQVPMSAEARTNLLEIMKVTETPSGLLLGKTGTGGSGAATPPVGWFVGIVESGERRMAFACVLVGQGASGATARDHCVTFFAKADLL